MTKYKTNDGHQFEAETEEELVGLMHEMSLVQIETDEDWMRDVAEAATEQSGKEVRYDTPENFVFDLISIGFITVEGERGKK
jgi:hypothetical protein